MVNWKNRRRPSPISQFMTRVTAFLHIHKVISHFTVFMLMSLFLLHHLCVKQRKNTNGNTPLDFTRPARKVSRTFVAATTKSDQTVSRMPASWSIGLMVDTWRHQVGSWLLLHVHLTPYHADCVTEQLARIQLRCVTDVRVFPTSDWWNANSFQSLLPTVKFCRRSHVRLPNRNLLHAHTHPTDAFTAQRKHPRSCLMVTVVGQWKWQSWLLLQVNIRFGGSSLSFTHMTVCHYG